MSAKWTEVWIDVEAEYVLLVSPDDSGAIVVRDPQEGGKVIARHPSYEEAVHWLNEDEYDLVEGRVSIE